MGQWVSEMSVCGSVRCLCVGQWDVCVWVSEMSVCGSVGCLCVGQ